MSASLEDIAAMVTFATVVRANSFSAAAITLGISKSAVSKRVSALEDRLGVRLLNRSTRSLATTEAGDDFFRRCERLLDEAESATRAAEAHLDEPSGLLRINGPRLFGQWHLAPLIGPLLAKWPRLRVELSLTDRFIDPIEERADVTVRVARLPDSSLIARKIADDRRVTCASPAYLARMGTPQTPDELGAHDCLRFTRIQARDEWRYVRQEGPSSQEFSPVVHGRFASDDGATLLRAAVDGVGMANLPSYIVAESLADGRLVPLLQPWSTQGHGIYALHPHARPLPPKVRVFLDALTTRCHR